MQIFIKTITGETITLVKERVAKIEGVPVQQQRLIYSGREMEDGRLLSFYNLQGDSTIHMMLALSGGRGSWYRCNKLWKLASYHRLQKKICRKCYGRLPTNATRCRKVKCGRTSNIRLKKCDWVSDRNRLPRQLADWTNP